MPTGVYVRTEEIRKKMRLSHQKGWVSTYKRKKEVFTKTGMPRELTRAMRGWTKWGGPNHGFMTLTPEWNCQACGLLQTDQLPAYRVKIMNGEYAKICSLCYHQMISKRISNIFDLISLVRSTSISFG